MKRFVVSVRNKTENSELGFSNMWMDGETAEEMARIAKETVSEATKIPAEFLSVEIKEKTAV